jgi:hypothetical protein
MCHERCPRGWLCETRLKEGGCGGAPLSAKAFEPPFQVQQIVAQARGMELCDRRNPPTGPHPVFEIACYDGGFTGNRYMMIRTMLHRAACCGGVALLPPEFDGFPEAGPACFDFRSRAGSGPLASGDSSCANSSVSSKAWWLGRSPSERGNAKAAAAEQRCEADVGTATLARLSAALYAGFGVPGRALGSSCPATSRNALVVHVRSGDIFTNWRNGHRTVHHSGYESTMASRGQPPLSFYLRALAHRPPPRRRPYDELVLVTSPDRSNPVIHALEQLAQAINDRSGPDDKTHLFVRVSASQDFRQDLTELLCAHQLIDASSSLSHMFDDSPNIRIRYSFAAHRGRCEAAPSMCQQTLPGAEESYVQSWRVCSDGQYTPLHRWNNTDAQQLEMLLHDNVTVPAPACTPPHPMPHA